MVLGPRGNLQSILQQIHSLIQDEDLILQLVDLSKDSTEGVIDEGLGEHEPLFSSREWGELGSGSGDGVGVEWESKGSGDNI